MLQTSQLKLVLLSAVITSFSACGLLKKSNKSEKAEHTSTTATEIVEEAVEEKKETTPKLVIPKVIEMNTTAGKIIIELYEGTPLHQKNFAKLIQQNYYDGLLFHRVIKDFMIQGGDPNSKDAPQGTPLGNGGPGYTIPAEITQKYYHKKGALCAARQGDNVNPEKRSSGSQFYIVTGAVYSTSDLQQMEARINQMTRPETPYKFNEEQIKVYTTEGGAPFLDNGYTVFGEVIEGMDIVEKIGNTTTQRERPVEDIKVLNIKIVK